jgi:hypothetical protein
MKRNHKKGEQQNWIVVLRITNYIEKLYYVNTKIKKNNEKVHYQRNSRSFKIIRDFMNNLMAISLKTYMAYTMF